MRSYKFVFLAFVLSILTRFVEANTACDIHIQKLSSSTRYSLSIGDEVEVQLEKNGELKTFRANFLGLSRYIDGSSSGVFVFDAKELRIHFVGMDSVSFFQNHNGLNVAVPSSAVAPIVRSINQQGGTCAAFAIFNCMRQLYLNGFEGNGMVHHHMQSEPSRTRFWAKIDHDYYGDGNYRDAEHNIALELGFKKESMDTRSAEKMADFMRAYSEAGFPFLIFFDVGAQMWRTPYVIYSHVAEQESDRRLWTPSENGRHSGGHQILGVKVFTDTEGKEWIVVVDSNWQAPRLWPIEELSKYRSGRIGGWGISQVGPNPAPDQRPPAPVMLFDADIDELQEPTDL